MRSMRLACSFNLFQKNQIMKNFASSTIRTFGATGNDSTNFPGHANNGDGNTENGAKKRNDPNRVDPTKQDERDNDPTRIRPNVNEPDKNDPTTPEEPGKIPQPGSEKDQNEQPKKTIGFLREE
jgi:hypothetical protein